MKDLLLIIQLLLKLSEIQLKRKLDSIAYKPLLASAGGVERATRRKYNTILDNALSKEERRDIFLHELTHIHYADTTPTI